MSAILPGDLSQQKAEQSHIGKIDLGRFDGPLAEILEASTRMSILLPGDLSLTTKRQFA